MSAEGRGPAVHVRPAAGETTAVVLVLYGGKEHSFQASEPLHLSSRRMRPFARALSRQGAMHGVAVWTVQYRVRGWNGEAKSPVHDARWALDEVRRRHGHIPVVLVGHSMGGRAAVHVLDDASVIGMVGLAPWISRDDDAAVAAGRSVLFAHGILDRSTSPRQSRRWAEEASTTATAVTYVRMRRAGHFLLRRTRLWNDLTVGFSLQALGIQPRVGHRAGRALAQRGTITL